MYCLSTQDIKALVFRGNTTITDHRPTHGAKTVSDYDQKIPLSHTADKRMGTARKGNCTLTVTRHQEDN